MFTTPTLLSIALLECTYAVLPPPEGPIIIPALWWGGFGLVSVYAYSSGGPHCTSVVRLVWPLSKADNLKRESIKSRAVASIITPVSHLAIIVYIIALVLVKRAKAAC